MIAGRFGPATVDDNFDDNRNDIYAANDGIYNLKCLLKCPVSPLLAVWGSGVRVPLALPVDNPS